MKRPATAAVVLAALILCQSAVAAELRYVWEDDFSSAERQRLVTWIDETAAAVETLVGTFPMDVRVHVHRRDGAREPVPWANTQRYPGQGVHLHVNPDFPLQAFRDDWTAPHEFAHLMLPYVGRQHAWFAEGFASYMQYRVMQTMGVLSTAAAERRYRDNLRRAERDYDYPDRPFVDAASRLRADGRYPVMYWGGAAYFGQVDAALARRGSSLVAVVRDYMGCCRRNRAELAALIAELDRLSGTTAFGDTLARFRVTPGFPEFHGGGQPAGD